MKWSALAAVVFISCFVVLPAQSQNRVVAEIEGEYEVTVAEVKEYLESRPQLLYGSPRDEAFRQALEGAVTEELKRVDFFKSGLARDSAFLEEVERNVTEELVLAYGKNQYEDRYLNEKTIRTEHEEMGRVVGYRQIVLPKPPDASEAVLDSLRATVKQIRRQIDEGAPFDTLAQRYSEEGAYTQQRGGLSWVNWQQTRRNSQAYVLFHLSPGEVRSFEGAKVFSVARVERVKKKPVPPLDEVREKIVNALHGWNATKATRAFRQEWNALVDTSALRWNAPALKQVVEWSNTSGFFEGDYPSTVQQYLAEHGDAQILTDGRGEVRLRDLPRLFDEVLTLEESGGHDREYIKEFLLEAVRTKRLADRARAMGLEDKVLRPDTPSPVLANKFVQLYNQEHIEDRLPEPTEAALRDFYEAHDDSLFYQLARVNTKIIVRSDKEEIEKIWDKVQQGASFDEVSHRRLVRSYERKRDGEIVTRNTQEPAYLGEVAFGLEEGEVTGPVAFEHPEKGRRYAIVRAIRRLEERQLAFDEVRDRVAEAFTEHHRARIAAEVAKKLREKYEVTIYEDVLDRFLAANSNAQSP